MSRSLILMATTALVLAAVASPAASAPGQDPFPFQPNPEVAGMIAGVQPADVYAYTAGLTGETPITVAGQPHTLLTRNTLAADVTVATSYVYEFLQTHGLAASYHLWEEYAEGDWLSGRNVVGELPGTSLPTEIVLVTAHLDDMPGGPRAPGADDNASGAVAVIMAAARLAGHSFQRTLRFVFFTGEEQGLLGSWAYAQDIEAAGENIVAVLNMDMIGWDANDDGAAYLETRRTKNSGYAADLAIANVLVQVVDSYGLAGSLDPIVDPCGDPEVDSWSFWQAGYPSVTAIEDFDWEELNPNYHTVNDELDTLNLEFLTSYVKAVVGTSAHLALPVFDVVYTHAIYLPLVLK